MQEIIVPCRDPEAAARTLGELGFEIDYVLPADAPQVIVVVGHNARMRLVRDGIEPPLPRSVPTPRAVALAIHRGGAFRTGRAGMQYRDLVPDRLDGWLIASHIRIPDAGPVPDYVHHHAIRVQVIYCRAGWVRVAYEDQGEPIVMEAGDCVTQPPGIRHRVLECSAGLEVIELASPAAHPTLADRATVLGATRERAWAGQRFVWHRARGRSARDLELDGPTCGLASGRVHVARTTTTAPVTLGFVLVGTATIGNHALTRDDAFIAPVDTVVDVAGELLAFSLA